MELIIIINKTGKRYEIEEPTQCTKREMEEWIFAELEGSIPNKNNRLKNFILNKLTYISNLKMKKQ